MIDLCSARSLVNTEPPHNGKCVPTCSKHEVILPLTQHSHTHKATQTSGWTQDWIKTFTDRTENHWHSSTQFKYFLINIMKFWVQLRAIAGCPPSPGLEDPCPALSCQRSEINHSSKNDPLLNTSHKPQRMSTSPTNPSTTHNVLNLESHRCLSISWSHISLCYYSTLRTSWSVVVRVGVWMWCSAGLQRNMVLHVSFLTTTENTGFWKCLQWGVGYSPGPMFWWEAAVWQEVVCSWSTH